MFGNYLAIALRTFRRRPLTTAVNVIALALGLTCFVAAYAVVEYWDHAEQGFAKADRTYVMTGKIHIKSGGFEVGPIPSIDTTLVDTLREDFPQFETVARATNAGDKPIVAGDKKVRLFAAYADKQFLDVFDLPFVAGDARTALDKPESAVLTTEAAERLFGTTNAVGRSFRYDGLVDLTVTGVIGDIPQPSHIGRSQTSELRFDVLASWDVSDRIDAVLAKAGRQGASGEAITYVVLPKGSAVTPQSLAPAFAAYVQRRVPEAQRNFMDLTLGMIPVRKMMASRLNTMLLSATGIGISVSTLLILLGGLVLVVACVNYTVLATGQAIVRAKEVGLRKVIGAGRRQIVAQHLTEAGILTGLGLILAVAAIEAISPVVQQASGVDLSLPLLSGAGFCLFVVALLVGVTLLAGAYPALVLSKVRPIHALRQGGIHGGAGRVQSLFVGVQFCVASFLLIVVIVMWAQTGDLQTDRPRDRHRSVDRHHEQPRRDQARFRDPRAGPPALASGQGRLRRVDCAVERSSGGVRCHSCSRPGCDLSHELCQRSGLRLLRSHGYAGALGSCLRARARRGQTHCAGSNAARDPLRRRHRRSVLAANRCADTAKGRRQDPLLAGGPQRPAA